MHIPRERVVPTSVAFLTIALLLVVARVDAEAFSFVEDFSATTRRDASSTVVWDTVAKEARLSSAGASWEAMSALNGVNVTTVAFSPSYASDQTAFVGASNGIYRTTDGGSTWTRVAVTAEEVAQIALSSAFASDRIGFAITNGDGLRKTTNGGTTWVSVNAGYNGLGIALSPSFVSDRTVFLATFAGILKSTDGGATWSAANTGIDAAVLENGDLRGIAMSRGYASDRTVFATAFGVGVYRSTDAGATWAVANPSGISVSYATAIATGPGGIVAAAFYDGAYRSGDNGGVWKKISSGDANDIAFTPSGTETAVFLATTSGPAQWKSTTSSIATGWSGAASAIGAGSTYPDPGSVIAGRSSGASIVRTGGYWTSAIAMSTAVDATANRIARTTLTTAALLPPGTSIVYHLSVKDGAPVWEGPVTPGTPWTFTEVGSTLRWRATLVTMDTAATPTLTRVGLAYETTEVALTAPTPSGGRASASSIRWLFSDTATDETGFEIHVGTHGSPDERVVATTKPNTVQNFTHLDEEGLTPNTSSCGRHAHALRGAELSPPSAAFACQVTLAAIPPAPIISDVTSSSAVLRLGTDSTNPADTQVSIRDATSGTYVGGSGTLGASAVWRTRAGWSSGVVSVTGLTPDTAYAFCAIAQNRAQVATACSPTVAVRTITPPPTPEPKPPKEPEQPPVEPTPEPEPSEPPQEPEPSEPPKEPASGEPTQPPAEPPPSGEPPSEPSAPQPGEPTTPTAPSPGEPTGEPAPGAPATGEPSAPPPEPSPTPSEPTPPAAPVSGGGGGGGWFSITSRPEKPTLTIAAPAHGSVTSAATIVVSGRTASVISVALAVDGTAIGTVVSDSVGAFSAVTPPLSEGAHVVTATAAIPNRTPLTANVTFTVDRTSPPAPVVSDVRTVERVASSTRGDAFDVTFEVRGVLTPAEFAELDMLLVTVASDPVTFTFRPTSPEWSYRNTTPLTPGSHTVRVAARDRGGNVSALPQALSFIVPPAACGDRVDNDGDALIDYPNDPDCRNVIDNNEAPEGVVTRAVTAVKEATVVSAKAVATTTVTAVKATAKTAERTAVVVQERVLDNPTVEVATERVIAPTVAVAVVANTATAAQGFQFLTYLQYLIGFILQPSRLLGRRKRKGWGTVYASLSKRPLDLATVRLLDAATRKVVGTAVTDHLGRYQFAVKRAGAYRIAAARPGYTFPSTQLKGKKEDTAFTDLYHGEPITVGDAGAFIAVNVPLDAMERREAPEAKVIRQHYLQLVSVGVSTSGLVLSFVSFSVSPRPYVAVILAVNLLLYFLFRRIALARKRPKSWGAIIDAGKRSPLHLAVVRLFDTEFNKLLETAVTDRFGRYSFLVGKSVYYVTGQKPGFALAKSDTIDTTKVEGVVGVDLRLKPIAHSP